ncbi:MAG TPA: DUF2177 family protein [Spirochaetota bacterium]|nr:DUF2177 family protein [Spirochaetota bacterium]
MRVFALTPFFWTAGVSVIIFVVLDLLWLAVIASRLYFKSFGYLAHVENGKIVFNLYAGLAAQAVISLALTGVIVLALHTRDSVVTSIIAGAAAGFALYATYDLTNLSFVKGYPVLMSVVDIAWGTAQGVFAGIYVFYLLRLFS